MTFDFNEIQFKNLDGSKRIVAPTIVAEGLYDNGRSIITHTLAERIYRGTPFEINRDEISHFIEYLNGSTWFYWLKIGLIEYLQGLLAQPQIEGN